MRVRCLATFLTAKQSALIGIDGSSPIEVAITRGAEYVVLGITIMPSGSQNGSGAFFEVRNDWGQCQSISACLFEIVDPRCSR